MQHQKRRIRARDDLDLLVGDLDALDEEAQVTAGDGALLGQQQLPERALKLLDRGDGVEVRRRLRRRCVSQRFAQLLASAGQLAEPLGNDDRFDLAGLERALPLADATLNVVKLGLQRASLLVSLLAQRADLLDCIGEDLAAALDGEELVGEMLQHCAFERVGTHAEARTALLALARRGAAVVVAVRPRARAKLARGRFELVRRAALAAEGAASEQQRARRPTPRVSDWVALVAYALRLLEEVGADHRLDRDGNPLLLWVERLGLVVDLAPVVGTDGRPLIDDLQDEVLGEQSLLAVAEAALVQVARRRQRAALLDVSAEDLDERRHLRVARHQLRAPEVGLDLDLLDLETERWTGAVEEAAACVLAEGGARAQPVQLRLVLVKQLEHALGQTSVGIVSDLLADGDDAHAVLGQILLVLPRAPRVSHEATRLVDEDRIDLARRREHLFQHQVELTAVVVGTARTGLDVLGDDDVAALVGVLAQCVELRRQGQVLLSLLQRGHAHVQNHSLDLVRLAAPTLPHRSPPRCSTL